MKPQLRFPLGLTFLLILAPVARTEVIISEFMADNKTTLADEEGQFSDWIEIYNTGTNTVNLNGWSLTDDPARQALADAPARVCRPPWPPRPQPSKLQAAYRSAPWRRDNPPAPGPIR